MDNLTKGSHKKITVDCDFKLSNKCIKQKNSLYKDILANKNRNNGKYICLYCSRYLKHSNRNNPNCKYKSLDDYYFRNIESEDKAYLLGWIASDGHISNNGFTISINKKDEKCLRLLRDIICKEIPICTSNKKPDMKSFTINSKNISNDLCKLLNVVPSKNSFIKSFTVQIPLFDNKDNTLAFIRGYFDGDGSVTQIKTQKRGYPAPKVSIASSSQMIRDQIQKFIEIPCWNSDKDNKLEWWGNNALDFLNKIYSNTKLYLDRKYELYQSWSTWVPGLSGNGNNGNQLLFKWCKTDSNAVAPSKNRATDSGYDLTIIKKIKEDGLCEYFDTGIKIQPDYGWYFDLLPRSSTPKTGYMLFNSTGIIDRSYIGNIIVALIKVDKNKPDLKLPTKIVQIIPRPIVHMQMEEVDSFDETSRNDKGFGSSDDN